MLDGYLKDGKNVVHVRPQLGGWHQSDGRGRHRLACREGNIIYFEENYIVLYFGTFEGIEIERFLISQHLLRLGFLEGHVRRPAVSGERSDFAVLLPRRSPRCFRDLDV